MNIILPYELFKCILHNWIHNLQMSLFLPPSSQTPMLCALVVALLRTLGHYMHIFFFLLLLYLNLKCNQDALWKSDPWALHNNLSPRGWGQDCTATLKKTQVNEANIARQKWTWIDVMDVKYIFLSTDVFHSWSQSIDVDAVSVPFSKCREGWSLLFLSRQPPLPLPAHQLWKFVGLVNLLSTAICKGRCAGRCWHIKAWQYSCWRLINVWGCQGEFRR